MNTATQTSIVNIWKSTPEKTVIYEPHFLGSPIKESGDYSIYKTAAGSFLYTYKGYSISELAGLNLEHFNNLVNRNKPKEMPIRAHYARAIENINSIERIINA